LLGFTLNLEEEAHGFNKWQLGLNNVVEQDHRAVKRVTQPMLGFKSFDAAQDTLVGIELMHMIKKIPHSTQLCGRGAYTPVGGAMA
jgi:transposase-like protein